MEAVKSGNHNRRKPNLIALAVKQQPEYDCVFLRVFCVVWCVGVVLFVFLFGVGWESLQTIGRGDVAGMHEHMLEAWR